MKERILELTLLLAGEGADQSKVRFSAEYACELILMWCAIRELPEALLQTAVCLAAEIYHSIHSDSAEKELKGITRGDVSYTYLTETEKAEMQSSPFLMGWKEQLSAYRKLRW